MKIGTTGFLRLVKSAFDYAVFYEIRLAKRPWLVVSVLILSLIFPIAIMVLGPRDWWLHPNWAFLVYAAASTKFIWNFARSNTVRVGKFEVNNKVLEDLKSAHPPEEETQAGFVRVMRNSGFDGPVIISDEFNAEYMCDAATDWPLVINNDRSILAEIILSLKSHSAHFVNFGRQAMARALLRNKALVNEKKVAFAEAFPPTGSTVTVFQTDYFTSLCSADRRLEEVVAEVDGTNHVLVKAEEWQALNWRDGKFQVPKIFQNSPPMSLHIGVEVLAVSSDDIFRIAVQSKRTEFSQNMRAPLASGSADWSDAEQATSLKMLIRNAARRELSEEWGDASPTIAEKLNLLEPEPIGYFRNVLRLGKPQFVCLVRLNCKDHELSADASEVRGDARSRYEAHDLNSLKSAVDKILNHRGDQIDSAPLLGAVGILRDLIEKRPDRIAEILGYQLSEN